MLFLLIFFAKYEAQTASHAGKRDFLEMRKRLILYLRESIQGDHFIFAFSLLLNISSQFIFIVKLYKKMDDGDGDGTRKKEM